MPSKQFSVGEMIKFGWETMKAHLLFFIIAVIIGLVVIAGSWMAFQWSVNTDQHWALESLLWVVAFVLSAVVQLGLINIGLRYVDQKNVNLGHLFSIFPQIIKFIAAHLLYSLMVIVGLALFIVPGVYLGIKYCLYPYFIIDREAGPLEALNLSGEATDGAKWDILAFQILSILISWLGLICLVIGLFAALPTLWVAGAAIYRRLTRIVL